MNATSEMDRLTPRQQSLIQRALAGDRIAKLWLAPWRAMERPDPWQKDALSQLVTRGDNVLMLCSRGAGKTETFAVASYLEACLGGFAMILSRSDRQALRVIARVAIYARKLNLVPIVRDTMHELVLKNGGRILALPCSGDTIVGEHGVTLLGMDEAARIPDAFYAVVTPMLAVSKEVTGIDPRLALLSTPYGQRGFFWNEWEGNGAADWRRHRYPWTTCPRITLEYAERERMRHGNSWFEQEYECKFLGLEGGYFDVDRVETCFVDDSGYESRIPKSEQIEAFATPGLEW